MGYICVGERIRKAREEKGLTRNELTTKAALPKMILSRYENGARNPTLQHIKNLSKALNADKCWLAFGEIHNNHEENHV